MKNVIKTLVSILKALPIVIELLETFTNRKETPNNSSNPRSDKDIIGGV